MNDTKKSSPSTTAKSKAPSLAWPLTLAKIAEMPKSDRDMAERIHAVVKANAPELKPKLWYGMPAYAKDGKVVCFFTSADKFKSRCASFGFEEAANLDEGSMWPTAYALTKLTAADEKKIGADPWRIRSLEVEHGIRLPEDAKAVWLWHDGVAGQNRFSTPFWGDAYYFLDLESSILDARMRLNIRNSGDVSRRPGSSWATLGQATVSTAIDLTEPHDAEGSPVLISDATASIEEYPVVTLSERIRLWNSAIENNIWHLDDERRWRRHEDRAMDWPERALL